MGKLIYLTGAPASGKSSTARLLSNAMPELLIWEYGARLTEYLTKDSAIISSQDELREKSAAIVTSEDIAEVDKLLVKFVEEYRVAHNIIIDSHPVTKENYGYRITPFSLDQFNRLAPDEIWVFYAQPEVTIKRIGSDAAGRPTITVEEARFHTHLQASVAATYGMSAGTVVHLFDTNLDQTGLVESLVGRLK